jgi:CheY-like chemotaxis protein
LARKILLADDSVTAQNMGRRILTDAGYDVTTVNNGSAALKKIAESKPDLIILDVYMPGYGGLELCQRLREAPETARIPVLLSVGKLEPFKADEARRVRADGFIVKPFEASELLTALAKLEDKIVPQGQPQKPSRFARAMAAADESAQAKEFGDSETGWKNRLSIPPPHSKPREGQPEGPAAIVAGSGDASQRREASPSEMKSGLEEALLSSLPQDITAEEIAAIKAAAAAFSLPIDETAEPGPAGNHRRQTQELSPESVASLEKETGAATFASAPEPQAETALENIAPKVEAEPAATSERSTASETEPAITVSPDSAANTAGRSTEARNLGDEEVTAALASLAPSNGHGQAAAMQESATRELMPVTMAAAQEFSGPRWMAEPVGLGEGESSLALEQEMERAFAAFAAADSARLSFASSTVEPSASFSSAESAAAPETPAPQADSFSSSSSSETTTQESAAQTNPASAEESGTQESARHVDIALSAVDAVSDTAVSEIKEEAALAAAASSGSGESTIAAETLSQPAAQIEPSASTPHPGTGEHQGESDLAAAWANWKHIRETVLGSQVSDSATAEVNVRDEVSPTQSEPQSAEPSTQEETEEISNIVDSVLADLKPKLMQEIARKMGREPKNK